MDSRRRVRPLRERLSGNFLKAYGEECRQKRTMPHVNELAQRLAVSASAVTKAYRRLYGINPAEDLKSAQIVFAAELLESTDLPVADVARLAGFRGRESLDRSFKRLTGMTPTEFRRKSKNGTTER